MIHDDDGEDVEGWRDERGADYFDHSRIQDEEDEEGCEDPEHCLMPSIDHLRSECYTREDAEARMDAQLREEYATTNKAMLARLRLICDELYQYAYGKMEDGERFESCGDIGMAEGLLNEAIKEGEKQRC